MSTPRAAFLLGVNYPWLHYGEDFGRTHAEHKGVSVPAARDAISRDFASIRDSGASIVRWFLFADGRGGFSSEKGIPRRPGEFLFADLHTALELAGRCQLKLWFSLIDFLWLQDHQGTRPPHAHEHVLHFAAGREAFLQHVLIPLFREFRAHPALFAWEIANEPEWAIREFHPIPAARLHFADFRRYASEIAAAVREFAEVPVTLGSARFTWLRAWTELGIDFYQAHFYPSSEEESGGDLAKQLLRLPSLDKPLWLGELPVRDPLDSGFSLARSLDLCRNSGLSGAAIWRWTKPSPGSPDLPIGHIDPAVLKSWSNARRGDIQIA